MKKKTDERNLTSEAIDLLRFPLAVLVVFVHAYGSAGNYMVDYNNFSSTSLYALITIIFSHVISHIAVPTFFTISGYLFYKKLEQWNWTIWKQKMRNRWHTLVVPYFLWCFLFMIWIPIQKLAGVVVKGKPIDGFIEYIHNIPWLHGFWDSSVWGGTTINWLGEYAAHNTGPMLVPFWFLRDLMVVVLLTPIIYWLLKKLGGYFVAMMALFYISGIWPDIHGLRSTSLFFFSFGAWFSLQGKDICQTLFTHRWKFYIPFLILLPIITYMDEEQTYGGKSVFIIFGVLSYFCFSFYLVKQGMRKSRTLVGSCFIVYAFHIFILERAGSLFTKLIGDSNGFQLIAVYICKVALVIGICILLSECINRYLPRLKRYLTGGR